MTKNWIAADWGSSNLRLWHLDEEGNILNMAFSDQGMGSLAPEEFEPCLLKHIEPWLDDTNDKTLVLACGMVGARQGWYEAEYIATPCAALPPVIQVPTLNRRLDVRIAAGIKQIEPADVMRGEETQIAGFLATQPHFEGIIALPGTHIKWVQVKDGQILRFQTLLTGESFALYAKQSVLRFSMGYCDENIFIAAALEAFQNPQIVAAKLFNIRANDLLFDDKTGESRLSGLLIGQELAATKSIWQGQKVVIIGSKQLIRNYMLVFQKLNISPLSYDGKDMVLAGLKDIKRAIS